MTSGAGVSDHWETIPAERNTAHATKAREKREDQGEAAWLGVGSAIDVISTVWADHPDTLLTKTIGGHF